MNLQDCETRKNELQASILQTVGQSDEDLQIYLSPFVDSIWCVHGMTRYSCDLKYLLTQRDLTNMALGHVRNLVDTSQTRGNSSSSVNRRTDSHRESHSQRKGHAIACSWSTATSYRTFARDSSSSDRSKSNAWSTSSGSFARNSNSSSYRSSMGWSYGINTANTDVNGINQMDGVQTHSRGATQSSSNFKRNVSYSTDIQMSAPLIGTVRWRVGFSGTGDWGNKGDSNSVDTQFSKSESTASTTATSNSNTDDSSASSSSSNSVSDATGTSTSYGSSAATAQAAGIASAHSEAHSGSQNTSHSEAEQASEAWSKSNYLTTGSSSNKSDNKTTTTGSKWGQIFDSLKALLDETITQIEETKRVIAMSAMPVITHMENINCNPYELIKCGRPANPFALARPWMGRK